MGEKGWVPKAEEIMTKNTLLGQEKRDLIDNVISRVVYQVGRPRLNHRIQNGSRCWTGPASVSNGRETNSRAKFRCAELSCVPLVCALLPIPVRSRRKQCRQRL